MHFQSAIMGTFLDNRDAPSYWTGTDCLVCTGLYRLVLVCTTLYWFVLVCIDW